MDDLDTFEGWLKYQQMDLQSMPEDMQAKVRSLFEEGKSKREAARLAVAFSRPCPVGEYRYAVAIDDGGDLRLTLVVRRSPKPEYFILFPRDGEWNPHASYHLDGTYHNKSSDLVLMREAKKRQRLDQFKGTEHLGLFLGHGTAAPICNPANFTSVLKVPPGILGPRQGGVLVDLVAPGSCPNPLHRDGRQIVLEKTYDDGEPWIAIAIVR
jgi:hypothetical protein